MRRSGYIPPRITRQHPARSGNEQHHPAESGSRSGGRHTARPIGQGIPFLVEWLDLVSRPRERRKAHVTTAVAPSPQFTALDRCDRCGAQAYVRVELVSGGELLFCAHHAREHAEKLQAVAAAIHDESGQLEKAPSTAPDDEL